MPAAAVAAAPSEHYETYDVNDRYFAAFVARVATERGDVRVLDFGCGTGRHLRLIRAEGIDCHGTDLFYDGSDFSDERLQALLHEGVVRAMPDPRTIPYEDDSFDVIISDQVFEHVEDLDAIMFELRRVLRPGGVMLHHFPSLETIREPHIGIPFAHRLSGRARRRYVLALRRLGLGSFKGDKGPEEWTDYGLDWIDKYCYYRPIKRIEAMAGPDHRVEHRELEYCRFRASGRPLVERVLGIAPLGPVYAGLFRRLGSVALEIHHLPADGPGDPNRRGPLASA